jgi:hypothetical protein
MAISGNLRTMPFADLLQWISMSQKTGTLVIKGSKWTKKVLFQQGRIAAVASNNPREHLGYFLVGWGLLSEDELRELLDRQQHERVMLGDLLVRAGRMAREEIQSIIQLKTEESVFDLMLWHEGEFFFLDDDRPKREFQGINLPVDHFLFEGARQADERRRAAEVIPSTDHIPTMTQGVDEESLSPRHRGILHSIDGISSIEQIALRCRVPTFDVMSFVYRGVLSSVIGLLPPAPKEDVFPAAGVDSWTDSVRNVEISIVLGDLLEAYEKVRVIRERFADCPEALEAAENLERKLALEIDHTELNGMIILELAVSSRDMVNLSCGPEEAFILSRIDGVYALPQVLAQLPGQRLKNQLIIHGLLQRGIVKIQESRAISRYQTAVGTTGS